MSNCTRTSRKVKGTPIIVLFLFLFREGLVPLDLLDAEDKVIQTFHNRQNLATGQWLPPNQVVVLYVINKRMNKINGFTHICGIAQGSTTKLGSLGSATFPGNRY